MKLLLSFISFLIVTVGFAQNGAGNIKIPMKDGRVFYETSFVAKSFLKKEDLINMAAAWMENQFPNVENKNSIIVKKDNEILGNGIFKIVTSESGNYFWMKFVIHLKAEDGKMNFIANEFYEKPIEKGVSNEYSKIEYRWWDYRQGKPWSVEDEKLFAGIEQNMNAIIQSLEKDMGN